MNNIIEQVIPATLHHMLFGHGMEEDHRQIWWDDFENIGIKKWSMAADAIIDNMQIPPNNFHSIDEYMLLEIIFIQRRG